MNKSIGKIFRESSRDRKYPNTSDNPKSLLERDKNRIRKTKLLVYGNKLRTGADFYYAAMILHHSNSVEDSRLAVRLAETSHELGYRKALRLYAFALDRLLMEQGKKQKFGTQYLRKNPKSKYALWPVDPSTTDKERKIFGVAPLSELRKNVSRMNLRG